MDILDTAGQEDYCLEESTLLLQLDAGGTRTIPAGAVVKGAQLVGSDMQPVEVINAQSGQAAQMIRIDYLVDGKASSHTVTANHLVTLQCRSSPWAHATTTHTIGGSSASVELEWFEATGERIACTFRYIPPNWKGDWPDDVDNGYHSKDDAIEAAVQLGSALLRSGKVQSATGNTTSVKDFKGNKIAGTGNGRPRSLVIPFVVTLEEAKGFALEWLAHMAAIGEYHPLEFGDLTDVPAGNLLQWSEWQRSRFALVRATAATTTSVIKFTVTQVQGGNYASIQVKSEDSRMVLADGIITHNSALRSTWMRERDGFLLVYSVTDRGTFESLNSFYEQLSAMHEDSMPPIVLVANKADLQNKRAIKYSEGKKLAESWNNCAFIETSAKSGENIDGAFAALVREIRVRQAGSKQEEKPQKRRWCTIL